jgi:predicted ester cyclase
VGPFLGVPASGKSFKITTMTIVTPFYTQALAVNAVTAPAAVLEEILADHCQSINSQVTKDKATVMLQAAGCWRLIPDLIWEPQGVVVKEDRQTVVVRAVASGTPNGACMGLELNGSQSLKIDAIDIHAVEHAQTVRVYHLEDWATGRKKLQG